MNGIIFFFELCWILDPDAGYLRPQQHLPRCESINTIFQAFERAASAVDLKMLVFLAVAWRLPTTNSGVAVIRGAGWATRTLESADVNFQRINTNFQSINTNLQNSNFRHIQDFRHTQQLPPHPGLPRETTDHRA